MLILKKIICKQCGSVNNLGQISEYDDIVSCDVSEDLEWFLAMDIKKSESGELIYIDQKGRTMSRDEYIKIHKLDPEIAENKMKHHIAVYLGD